MIWKEVLHYDVTKSYESALQNGRIALGKRVKEKLSIGNGIGKMKTKEFITVKDHFHNNPNFRLLNPTTNNTGRINKKYLTEQFDAHVKVWKLIYGATRKNL